ncbi:MAG: hypothetical protein DRO09_01310 [Thermoprotei archaeon]|nr:MAG: hypothetical protein DRO09_01310 [Thermoprotei archaeon]
MGNPIIDGLCPKCFVKERRILELPAIIKLTTCPMCGSVLLGSEWVRVTGGLNLALEKLLNELYVKRENVYPGFSNVKVSVKGVDVGRASLIVSGFYRDVVVTQELVVGVRVSKRLCPRCLSLKTGAYSALVQVRYEGRGGFNVASVVSDVLSRYRELRESISGIEEVRDGIDIKFIDQSAARNLAVILKRTYGARIKQSWKSAGLVRGKRRSKLTVSVRLPALGSGDVIEFEGDLIKVTDVSGDRVVAVRLSNGKVVRLTMDALWGRGFKRLTEKDYKVSVGRVLAYEGGKAVVQDISSGEVYRLPIPRIVDYGAEVKILTYKGRTYLMI